MAAISLFWDTNMAAVTSCENTQKENKRRDNLATRETASYIVFRAKTQGYKQNTNRKWRKKGS